MGPPLRPGRVVRTSDLRSRSSNPSRLARRWVAEGRLRLLRRGLYQVPEDSSWGRVPPGDAELMRAFIGAPFVLTGPLHWNALGLGSTAVSPEVLVYNGKRSGVFELSGRRFRLRRVAFPRRPSPEWYAVDLLENHALSGVDLDVLERGLVLAIRQGRLAAEALLRAAEDYGTLRILALVRRAIEEAG